MSVEKFWEPISKFFSEDLSEVIGAYFDGEKIFLARLTKKFETIEVEFDGAEIEQLAEKISQVCRQKGWSTSAVGFCLRQEDAVTFQTETNNVPEKELPALVKSWAIAQAGAEAISSFAQVGDELWMETLPKAAAEEYFSAFEKFGLNLRAMSVMPAAPLKKIHPYERTEFITEIIRNHAVPNLLATRSTSLNLQRISRLAAAIFIIALTVGSLKLFYDYHSATRKLDAAQIAVDNLNAELALKNNIDEITAELRRINSLAAQVDSHKNFNLLINLGRIADKKIRLTKIRAEESFLEVEGVTESSDALKSYLGRVKNFVAETAQIESSAERKDGGISFVIRAALK